MSTPEDTFREEASELLTDLEAALLELEEDHSAALFVAEQLMQIAPHYAQGQMANCAVLIHSGEVEEGVELAAVPVGQYEDRSYEFISGTEGAAGSDPGGTVGVSAAVERPGSVAD